MNFLQLCQRLRQETGISDSGPSQVTGQTGDLKRIVDWVNNSYMTIQAMRDDWSWMWSSMGVDIFATQPNLPWPGVEPAKITPGTEFLFRFDYDNNQLIEKVPIKFMPWAEFYPRYGSTFEELFALPIERPEFYTRTPDGQFRLSSRNDVFRQFICQAQVRPHYLTFNTQPPLIPDHFSMVIVWHALMDYAMYDDAPELLQKGKINFDRVYADLSRETLPQFESAGPLA